MPRKALFVGDDCFTPSLIAQTGCELTAAFTDEARVEEAVGLGLNGQAVQLLELPQTDGGYDLVWYNGTVEFDGVVPRLETLKSRTKKGSTVVFRTLCWLIEPMPDTQRYYEQRFGIIEQMYAVVPKIKELGFKIRDFYIAPKSDWREHFYKPLSRAAQEYSGTHPDSSDVTAGIAELDKEIDMFERHGEEFSYVYFIIYL